MRAVLLIAALMWARPARAQDGFEIQVYDSETAQQWRPGIEIHWNKVLGGTRQLSSQGELPTHGVMHLTFEPHLGVNGWSEVGAYLQTAVRPEGGYEYAGWKVRWKGRIPWQLPVGLALNIELAKIPARWDAGLLGFEIRPIADVRLGPLYASVNPILGIDLKGNQAGRLVFEPAVKVTLSPIEVIGIGAEYYAGLGPIGSPLAASQQTHRVLGVVDLALEVGPVSVSLNLGAGYAFGQGAEGALVKAILGVDAAPRK